MTRSLRFSPPVLTAAAAALAIAGIGAWITDLGPWYYSLRQPAWKPPDWLFGPAWTLIFGLAALSAVSAWNSAPDRRRQARVLALFAMNGLLNIAWSLLFFRFARPDWALVEVALLWLSIAALIVMLGPFSRTAGWLLVPYIAWVTFAALLNYEVVRLNAPFT